MTTLPNLGLGLWAPTSLKYSPAQGPANPENWFLHLFTSWGLFVAPTPTVRFSNTHSFSKHFLGQNFSWRALFLPATIHWGLILCQSLFRVLNFLAGLIFTATRWNKYYLPTFPGRNLRPRVTQWPCGDTRLGAQMADVRFELFCIIN